MFEKTPISTDDKKDSKHESPVEKNEEALFDGLIQAIGDHGFFQKRFNLVFNCILVTLMTMPYLNLVMIMIVPEHHCHVPGRDPDRYSLREWQAKMLPREYDSKTGTESVSSCKMFINETDVGSCTSGYDYDRTWYASTVPSQNDWVCENDLYVANALAACRVGGIVGIFVFGQLGDKIGRKPVYFTAMAMLVIGRSLTVVTSHSYQWFIAAVLLGSAANVGVFQTPLVIGMEVSAPFMRAQLAFIQCVAWVVGSCALPMLQWLLGDWRVLMLATTLPCAASFLVYRIMPESPRWLAARGRVDDSARILKYIAKTNGAPVPADMYDVLQKIAAKKEKTYGIPSLFSNATLAKNTFMIIICWVVASMSYHSLLLNTSNMAGNPFMNFFWQALVELPAYVIARYLSNTVGRRWTHTASYVVVLLLCALVIITFGITPWLTTTLVTAIKLMFTISFYIVWLQAMEIYPTCVRQTGTSIGGLAANMFGVLCPYIVYLGTTIDARLPYGVLLCFSVLGIVCSCSLPETLNKKLPETLEDARNFGKGQKFWSFSK